MVNNERSEKIILFSLCFLICFSYLLGFYLNENSAGGGEGDFKAFTFNNIQFFDSNSLLEAIGVVNNDDTGKLFRSSRFLEFMYSINFLILLLTILINLG